MREKLVIQNIKMNEIKVFFANLNKTKIKICQIFWNTILLRFKINKKNNSFISYNASKIH